jgi:hypothetical protein
MIADAKEVVWYSGIGGEIVTWFNGVGRGSSLVRWEVRPDRHGRFPAPNLINSLWKQTHSLQMALTSDDVDRIVLGMPLSAPDSDVAARMTRKEFRSIDYHFDWDAYAELQNRPAFVPSVRHATILAAEESPSDRARRAAREAVDFYHGIQTARDDLRPVNRQIGCFDKSR